MPSVKFPINVNVESIDGDVDRAKIVNGYAELANAQETKVYSRPALNLAQGSFAAFGQGISLTSNNQLFVVSGGNLYLPAPSYSFGASITTLGSFASTVSVAYNGTAYFFSATSPFRIQRAIPPFSTFSTLGTNAFDGNAPLDAVVHNNAITVLAGTHVFYSTNGTSWGTYGAYGTGGDEPTRIYSQGATLYSLNGLPNLARYTSNLGTTWGTFTSTVSPFYGTNTSFSGFTDWAAVTHKGQLYALGAEGQGGVLRSPTAEVFEWILAPQPWASSGISPINGNRALSFNGNLLVFHNNGSTDHEVWASSNDGVTWGEVATSTSPSFSPSTIFPFSIAGTPYVVYGDVSNTRIFSLTGDGLSLVSALGSVNSAEGDIASVVTSESGVTFIKTTIAAYTVTNGALAEVSDAQYPAITVRGAVYLNGRLYVMEPDGTIWNSAEDDFTSWAGTDFINAEFEADAGVCLAKQGEYVIALGQFTTEAFYDAGNATGSPLDPVGSAVMLIGCAHANSVAQVETSLVWVAQQKGQGSTFHKGRFVAFMKGYGSYDRISTPDVERVLDADAFTEVYADILTIAGHVFYVLTLVDTDITLVYDFRSQLWYQWSLLTVGSAKSVSTLTQSNGIATATSTSHGFSDGDQVTIAGANQAGYNLTINVTRVDANTFTYPVDSGTVSPATGTITATGWTEGALDISASCYFDNSQIVQLRETGDVYVLDVTGTSDNGAPIDFRIRTRLWDAGTGREKFQNGLEVQGDKVASTGLVRYWDEDFTTATKFRRVDLSLRRPRVKRGGRFSRRAVEFRHTLSAKVGIAALEADIEMGEQ